MNTEIQQILLKQAAYVKDKSDTLSVAAQLRKAADLMEAEAKKTVPGNFLKLARQERASKIERFNANVSRLTLKDMDAQLKSNGWDLLKYNPENVANRTYHNKAYPGFTAEFKNNKLTVKFHGENKVKDLYCKDAKTTNYLNPSQFCKLDEQ